MHIFTSWSGERSKKAALGLRSLLEDIFDDAVQIFVSDHINPGEAWLQRLGTELERSEFGILCLTQENSQAPWLLFEAGAIAKKFGTSRVVPYLVDELSPVLDRSPLAQFQHVRADRDGTYRLVESINNTIQSGSKPPERLERSFARWWPDLEQTLTALQTSAPARSAARSDRELLEVISQRVEKLWEAHQSREPDTHMPDQELKHLRHLRDEPTMTYTRTATLQKELRHLRDLGLIKNKKPIAELPASFRLTDFFDLTDNGNKYLQEIESSRSR